MLQVICFTTSINIKVLVELTRNEFPLRNEFPILIPQFCKSHFFIENSTHPFFAYFQTPHPPLSKGEDFPAMKGVFRVPNLC